MSAVTGTAAPRLMVDGLDVRAGGTLLLRGVKLELASGELLAVVGPSGSGKTSLLRAVAGLRGDGASIRLDGEEPAALGWPAYRRRVVLVSQVPVLFEAGVMENLARPFGYRQRTTGFDAPAARSLLGELGLDSLRAETLATQLSVGQQQRVALVRALLLAPDVLLLDEPTNALDAAAAACVEETITARAAATGLAALVVTHSLEQAERWCHRRIDLQDFAPRALPAEEVDRS